MSANPRFIVETPPGRAAERRHAAELLFADALGWDCQVTVGAGPGTTVRLEGATGGVTIADGLLATSPDRWLKRASLPADRPGMWNVPARLKGGASPAQLPLLFPVSESPGDDRLNYDAFGTAFFLGTRYEEVVAPALDQHGRPTAAGTAGGRGGWMHRPVGNEIAAVVEALCRIAWPALPSRARRFRVCPTHDVDRPLMIAGRSPWVVGGGILRAAARLDLPEAARRVMACGAIAARGFRADPAWTFEWLMDESERRSLSSAFYFLAGVTDRWFDPGYQPDTPRMIELIGQIAARGHALGYHASYASSDIPGAVAAESGRLREVFTAAGVADAPFGGRHHFLRWDAARSWAQWDAAGLAYDSSVGFAGSPGFRSGFCCEHGTFDLQAGRALALRERPLALMEVSLLAPRYLGLSHPDAVDAALALAATCRAHAGDFVFLWHNDNLRAPADRDAYCAILDGAVRLR